MEAKKRNEVETVSLTENENETVSKINYGVTLMPGASSFDPNVFLNQEVAGANETKFTPVPEGEYKAYIDDLGMDEFEGQPILVVTYAILDQDDKLKKLLGLEKPTVVDRVFLDTNDDGSIAFGPNKNIRLGAMREAVGQNDPKKKWNFNMLRGMGPVLLKIAHRFHKVTGEGPFANVNRVVKAAA